MQALKPYLDTKNRRIARGQSVPDDYDKPTIAHYERLRLIGDKAEPQEKKPAQSKEKKGQKSAVEFPPADPSRKGGENNPLTEADAAADLAGKPRP